MASLHLVRTSTSYLGAPSWERTLNVVDSSFGDISFLYEGLPEGVF